MMKKELLTSLDYVLQENFDLMIVSASFEDRCVSVAKHLNQRKIDRTLVFYNNEMKDVIAKNLEEMEQIFGEKRTTIPLPLNNPLASADAIAEAMRTQGDAHKILLDITAFTHETLLVVLKLLKIVFPQAKTKCVYANAAAYSSENEKEKKWLSKGIGDIRSVLGYPGDISPDKKKHLIVIVGYEVERAIAAINAIEPHSLALGYGRSTNATTEKDQGANEHYAGLVKKMMFSFDNIPQFEVPCNDPCITAKVIFEEAKKHEHDNVLLLPMNNKITTIGAALIAQNDDRIQVCYAPAIDYNYTNYSTPGLYVYIFDLDTVCEGIF